MAKVLVLYYSTYGHMEKMAEAIAEGARGAGAQVDIKRVPETVPENSPPMKRLLLLKSSSRPAFSWRKRKSEPLSSSSGKSA